jgi:hypothetical protein
MPPYSGRCSNGRSQQLQPLGLSKSSGYHRDLTPWDLEDHPGVRDLLCEIGHQGPLSRDAHLRLFSERSGVALVTLQEAARELAQSAEAEP